WAQRHLKWLSKMRFDQPLLEVVFGEYLAHHEVLLARRERLDTLILEQSVQGPWAATVARLRCLRGVDTLTAVGLVAEIGDISAFAHPKQLASYLGLVPSEHSSGNKRRQGRSPKPAPFTPADCSSRRHGTTAVHPASRSRSAAASRISR
ncbi:MAG: transposase, partial [Solirubrobacteraceae bacterium]